MASLQPEVVDVREQERRKAMVLCLRVCVDVLGCKRRAADEADEARKP